MTHIMIQLGVGGGSPKRHRLGRFVDNKSGSSFLRPMHGDRHRRSQMSSMSKGRFSGRSSRFGL